MQTEPLIYVNREGQTYGPYTRAKALEHLKSGALVADDLARLEGSQNWMALLELIYPAKSPNPPKRNSRSVANWRRGSRTGLIIVSLAVLAGGGWGLLHFSDSIPSVFITKSHSLTAQEFKTKALASITLIEEYSYKHCQEISSTLIESFKNEGEDVVIDVIRLSLKTQTFIETKESQEKFFSILDPKIDELAECPAELKPIYRELATCYKIAKEFYSKTYSIPENAKEHCEILQVHRVDFEVKSKSLKKSLEDIN